MAVASAGVAVVVVVASAVGVVASVAAARRETGEMTRMKRLWRHLSTGDWRLRRAFPAATLSAITEAVRACESRHAGEIRFAVESALSPAAVWRGLGSRARAIDVFSQLRVWDTAHNNGVLIYVLLADRVVEIVADRGVAGGKVPQVEWNAACGLMQQHFRAGRYEQGSVAGIEAVAAILGRYPPGEPDVGNEMPDEPVLLR
ncbi:MAG: TPM domain-containing protein [Nevskia sp.]